jgi:hypothetical protein
MTGGTDSRTRVGMTGGTDSRTHSNDGWHQFGATARVGMTGGTDSHGNDSPMSIAALKS